MTAAPEPMSRCPWCGTDPLYARYHDQEWGVPEADGRALWENLVLEGFQAGLSWITILRRRETFRIAFAGFDPPTVARWGEAEVQRLLADPGIIRHRGKIEAAIRSAQAWERIEARQGFADFIWQHTDGRSVQNAVRTLAELPGQTEQAQRLAKALKAEGMLFSGPTIAYAFMQASGLVNDHLITCPRHAEVAALARG